MKPYQKPTLTVYGRVEEITATGCWFPSHNKTFGYPSDTNWNFVPISDCEFS